jgi:hypothetical protein
MINELQSQSRNERRRAAPWPSNLKPESSHALSRDPSARELYAQAALAHIPRLLGAIDRNPYRATYGCLDRQFWHYRTASFPSEMYQEGVLPLALVYAHDFEGNRWYQQPRVRELAIAAIRFAAQSCHRDGSCDDYYPFERALGAAVFSLAACAEAYRILKLHDPQLEAFLRRRADWLVKHDESGRLANHQALAALGLMRVARITGRAESYDAALARLQRVLSWQSPEGWFDEYGGADPGYQTVTIDCLARLQTMTSLPWLAEPLRRAVAFARHFLHPDDSYGGDYGSRGTYHFYPHGMELLAQHNADAADLADGFLRALARGKPAYFDDDRMIAHRLGNLLEAYVHWSPSRPAAAAEKPSLIYFPSARLLVARHAGQQTVASAARGGVFKHFANGHEPLTDAGLIVELAGGILAVSQSHDLGRRVQFQGPDTATAAPGRLTISGPLHRARFETATPLKQAVLHLAMWSLGRFCRTFVRKRLQRRLITGRRPAPVKLTRTLELIPEPSPDRPPRLRITDTIELTRRGATVRRMALASDLQSAYVAASGVYQDSVLQPWTNLGQYVDELNQQRRVTIVREIPPPRAARE